MTMRRVLAPTLALGIALSAVGAVSARQAATVKGTFTVKGKATPLTHVIAVSGPGFFDKTKIDTQIVFSDAVLTQAQVDDHFAIGDLARAGKIHAIMVTISTSKEVIGCQLYDPALGMSSISAVGTNNKFEGTISKTRATGKVYTEKPDDIMGNKYEFTVTFDVDVHAGK